MRIHKTLLAFLLAGLSLPVFAGLKAPVDAYEAALQHLQLPQSTAGTVTIMSAGCATCSSRQFRVNAQTSYMANGQSYSLVEYRRMLATVRDREDVYLTIVHNRDLDAVIAIRVDL